MHESRLNTKSPTCNIRKPMDVCPFVSFRFTTILLAAAQLIRSAEDEVQTILPIVKEAEHIMQLFGREYLTFDVSLQRTQVLL